MVKDRKTTRYEVVLAVLATAFICAACGGGPKVPPIENLKLGLKDVASYSILLEEMKDEGNFSKSYFHKYRVVQDEDFWITDWFAVSKEYYQLNASFMGMALVTKKEGKTDDKPSPPGYNHVGNPKYGRWATGSSGRSFWEFYGQYRLMTDLFGGVVPSDLSFGLEYLRPVPLHEPAVFWKQ